MTVDAPVPYPETDHVGDPPHPSCITARPQCVVD